MPPRARHDRGGKIERETDGDGGEYRFGATQRERSRQQRPRAACEPDNLRNAPP